jgi:hypothetical protein
LGNLPFFKKAPFGGLFGKTLLVALFVRLHDCSETSTVILPSIIGEKKLQALSTSLVLKDRVKLARADLRVDWSCICARRCYNNAYFAKVGGISLVEMNYLEVDFLFGVGFDLNVAPETFGDYCAVLRSELLCAEAAPAPLRLQHCCLSEDDAGAGCSAQQQLAAWMKET